MIGLPRETHDEVQGIVDLGIRAREIGRRVGGRFSVHVSASNFVPKPHTPFQWEGMAPREQLAAKQAYMRRAMPTRQIRLSLHDLRTSMLEGALSRGDERTGEVIERAWRAGARFDAWSEMFQEQAWHDAFAALDTSMDAEANREFGEWDELPWDHVRSGISKEYPARRVVAEQGRDRHRRLSLGRLRRLRRLLRRRAQPARSLSSRHRPPATLETGRSASPSRGRRPASSRTSRPLTLCYPRFAAPASRSRSRGA